MLSTTQGQCYILDIDSKEPNDFIEIQFVPEEIFFARSVRMEGVQIIGHNTPSYQYLGGESTVSMRLDFYANEESRRDVMRRCRWLESLTFNERLEEPPHRVVITFGKLFKNELWVVKNINYRVTNFHKVKNFLPQQAYVEITFGRWAEIQISASDVRAGFEFQQDTDLTHNDVANMLSGAVASNGITGPSSFPPSVAVNGVNQLEQNTSARDKLKQGARDRAFIKATKIFEYAKLGIALAKSFT